jgi:hypothetical protein
MLNFDGLTVADIRRLNELRDIAIEVLEHVIDSTEYDGGPCDACGATTDTSIIRKNSAELRFCGECVHMLSVVADVEDDIAQIARERVSLPDGESIADMLATEIEASMKESAS